MPPNRQLMNPLYMRDIAQFTSSLLEIPMKSPSNPATSSWSRLYRTGRRDGWRVRLTVTPVGSLRRTLRRLKTTKLNLSRLSKKRQLSWSKFSCALIQFLSSNQSFLNREIREEPVAEPAYTADAYNGDAGEKYISCYPYQSAEAGDLVFDAGEEVLVVKKDGDWWTGVIGNRTGIFPANYVLPPDNNASVTNGTVPDQTPTAMSAEEARNQADADSEVSQINTQNVSNDVNMQEFRGMTASAVIIQFHLKVVNFKFVLLLLESPSKERRSRNSHRPLRGDQQ